MSIAVFNFPEEFRFGVATAAAQIEGAASIDGKGQSTWDVFAQKTGAIFEGNTLDVACDHYHRLDEDLDLIAKLGVDSYRFSVSWPRVLPEGVGRVNEKGIAFYERLVDGLFERNVTPYLTLFHWDLPHALDQRGGFQNRDIVGWFAEYTELIARRFGDRVKHFLTINEPHAFIEGGLRHGRHAPGQALPLGHVLKASHHALMCHGTAVQVLRAQVRESFVVAAPVLICATPLTGSDADLEAARRYTFEMRSTDLRVSAFWMDPIYKGEYPESALRHFGNDMPAIDPSDLELIRQPLDAFGCNLYDAAVVRAGVDGEPEVVPPVPGSARTAFNWAVTPNAHYYGPRLAWERYRLPILITENGLSSRDWVAADGQVHDENRVDFIHTHLAYLQRAIEEKIPVLGYFHWSLLDNFEWNHGYRERFGLIHVDYQTLKRTPKVSYFSYRDIIRSGRNKGGA
jgi:beta-glucosidase